MGEFNLDDHWNYYCGQECLRRNGVAIRVNKRVQNAVLGCNCKNDRMISVRCMVLWRPTRQSRTNTQKRCPFYYRGPECKSRKSRANRQIWSWSTKRSRWKANRVFPEHTVHSKHPLPTTHEKSLHRDIIRWSIPKTDWLYSFCIQRWRSSIQVSKNKTGSWLWLRSWTPYGKIQT